MADPDHPARLLPSVDGGDHLHPNAAGYAKMARAWYAAIESFLPTSVAEAR